MKVSAEPCSFQRLKRALPGLFQPLELHPLWAHGGITPNSASVVTALSALTLLPLPQGTLVITMGPPG